MGERKEIWRHIELDAPALAALASKRLANHLEATRMPHNLPYKA